MDLLLLKILLVGLCTVQFAKSTSSNSWYKAMKWCYHKEGAEVHVGDFNGDGRTDMLCHDAKGYKWVALANSAGEFTGNAWEKDMGWCNHEGAKLYVGDFNGDGRTDMLCKDSAGYMVALAQSGGHFTGTSSQKTIEWCKHEGAQLNIGDFNGDGRDDMFCHDGGHMWVMLANAQGAFPGNTWHKDSTWCNPKYGGAKVYIGDFNRDGRDDLLCHDQLGNSWVKLTQSGGTFAESNDWSSTHPFCAGEDFHVGDMNGDNRADMVCNYKTSGQTVIFFADTNIHDLFSLSAYGRTRQCSGQKFLFLGDFNGDHRDDMLCHSNATGEKWIDYSNLGPAHPPPTEAPTEVPVSVEKLGCFKEDQNNRALNELIGNFKDTIDSQRTVQTAIEPCARLAKKRGWHYFGVQFTGECWSSPDQRASARYNEHGTSYKCVNGVGVHDANMVYKIIT